MMQLPPVLLNFLLDRASEVYSYTFSKRDSVLKVSRLTTASPRTLAISGRTVLLFIHKNASTLMHNVPMVRSHTDTTRVG